MGARPDGTKLWRGGIVPYEINPDLANIVEIQTAIRTCEQQTNARFVGRFIQDDYVRFSKQIVGQSNSEVGRQGGRQYLNAGTNDVGSLLHEIVHALGMMHEHQRDDRDDFVIFHANRVTGDAGNYEKQGTASFTEKYDYTSLMHYNVGDPSNPIFESRTGSPVPAGIGSTGSLTVTDLTFLESLYPAAPIIRRSDGQGGAGAVLETSSIAVPGVNSTVVVANAIRNGSGRYQLVLWRIRNNGLIQRMPDPPDATGGPASHVRIVPLVRKYVSAMKNANGELLLITHSDTFARLKDSAGQAGEVRSLDIVPLTSSAGSRVMTPCVSASDRLLNIAWDIQADGTIVRRFDSGTNGPRAKRVASVVSHTQGTNSIIAILYTNDSSRLVLSTWLHDGASISLISDSANQMGKADLFQLVQVAPQRVVAVCRDASQKLLLIPFDISLDGTVISRIRGGEGRGGKVAEIAAVARPYGLLTALISEGGHVLLIKWGIDANGFLARLGESGTQAGPGSVISVASLPTFSDSATVCTVVRNGSGNLLPISWDDVDGPGELSVQ